jgi:MFS family permease
MLDMYPPARRGSVMAIWGMGVMLGPILGPTLGGYLTDAYNWRWVFYINVPFGIASVAALSIFFKDTVRDRSLKFDWFGFSALSVGLASLQLLLDRGTDKGWFSSPEIMIEAIVAGTALLSVPGVYDDGQKTFHPIGHFQGPQFCRRVGADVRDGAGAAGQFGPAVALPAKSLRPQRHPDRAFDGAARARHHVRDDVRRPPDHEDGPAPADDRGRRSAGLVDVGDDQLDAGCEHLSRH